MALLEVKNLRKVYKSTVAVDDVSFKVMPGDVFGLLGPNGAGKSTIISMISGLVTPTGGVFYLKDHEVDPKSSSIKKVLGLVPQDIALYPSLSARENLSFWGRMYGLGGKTLAERVDEALEYCGLTDRAKEKIETYSGGMKRRVNIGAALLHKPELLIMDEPTVGIDPQSRNHILETVQRLNGEGVTVIYTSHYMEEVERLCNTVAIMDLGKVIASGTQAELRAMIGDADKIEMSNGDWDPNAVEVVRALEGVQTASARGQVLTVLVNNAQERLGEILVALQSTGSKVRTVRIQEPNLESVFLSLTGKALRD